MGILVASVVDSNLNFRNSYEVPKPDQLFHSCDGLASLGTVPSTQVLVKTRNPASQRGFLCVLGGDGGGSNSPSKRRQTRMYYRLIRCLLSALRRPPAAPPNACL
jgi:hypothetical protein